MMRNPLLAKVICDGYGRLHSFYMVKPAAMTLPYHESCTLSEKNPLRSEVSDAWNTMRELGSCMDCCTCAARP